MATEYQPDDRTSTRPTSDMSVRMKLPPDLVRNATGYGGEPGRRWLARLPALVADAARRWQMEDVAPVQGLSFNYLVRGRRGGRGVVAKFLWAPDVLAAETTWLKLQHANGAVRVFDTAPDMNAYLMADLAPLTPLTAADDAAATETLATLISRTSGLPAPAELPRIATWFADLPQLERQPLAGVDAAIVGQARAVADALATRPAEERLLHGDLHHDNVLAPAATSHWTVIDPKGVVGDPAHECAALFRNGLGGTTPAHLPRILRTRLSILADVTGFEPQRIAGWGFAQTVLSCCWAAQAGRDRHLERGWAVAHALRSLIE